MKQIENLGVVERQVVIPKKARELFGINNGDLLVVLEGNTV